MADTWVAREPDEHMQCVGLRWCGRCGEVAHHRPGGKGNCVFCDRRYREAWRRAHGIGPRKKPDPEEQEAKRAARYERSLERKRERYASDPVHAQAKRDDWHRRHAAA